MRREFSLPFRTHSEGLGESDSTLNDRFKTCLEKSQVKNMMEREERREKEEKERKKEIAR